MVLPTSVVYEQKDYKLLLEEIAKKDKQIEELHVKEKLVEKMARNLVESLNRSINFTDAINPAFFVDNICEFHFAYVESDSADKRIRGKVIAIPSKH